MRAGLVLLSALAAAPLAHAEPSLKQAAALYHQGQYDSALTVLDACRPGVRKHRDSLALFQYSGMASARLGRNDEAASEFAALLGLDSLFQFPRNEDPAILSAFSRAREARSASVPAESGEARARDTLSASRIAMADGEKGGASPVRAVPPGAGLVPIPAYPVPGTPPGGSGSYPAPPDRALRPQGVGLAMGAIPLGAGWLADGRYRQGLVMAVLQAGGTALSLIASSRISAMENDPYGIRDKSELDAVNRWQWTQRVALSTALGAYLFSLIASRRH